MKARPPGIETGTVTGLTLDGAGVAGAGKRVLVPGALAGETIRYERRRRRRNYDEARLLEVLEPSPDRVVPRCPYFGRCGGCSLQHLSPAAQIGFKQQTLLDTMRRLGGVQPLEVLPPVTADAWGYRRRARLAARHVEKKGRVLVGFREREKPIVADMLGCETVHPAIAGLIGPLSALIGDLSIRGRVPQVEATVAENTTALVIRTLDPPTPTDRERLLRFQGDRAVRIWLQPGDMTTLEPLAPVTTGPLYYTLPEEKLTLTFGPADFIQVNAQINRRLIAQAMALLEPAAGERVLDLYCGIGNFTLPLARRAAHVTGIEGAAGAVARLQQNARLAGLDNVAGVTGDLAGAAMEGAWTRHRFDKVLLDPPRTGAEAILGAIAGVEPRKVVYVSCHPGTLARDAGILVGTHGFTLVAAGILDMFPHTSHVESIALLVRE